MGRRKATFTVVATAGQNGTKRTRRIDQSTELRLKGWCDIPRHEMGSGFHRRVHLCLRAGKPHGTRQVRSGQVKCGHTPGRSFAIARPILSDNLSRGGVNLNSTVTMTLRYFSSSSSCSSLPASLQPLVQSATAGSACRRCRLGAVGSVYTSVYVCFLRLWVHSCKGRGVTP